MSLFQKAAELSREGKSFVTVTLLASRGHAPQDPGAKALVTSEGLHSGTVGGGKLEARAIVKAKDLLAQSSKYEGPIRETWNLQRDIGMSCGGEVEILFEVHAYQSWKLVVFGAGHVGQATVRLLSGLNCQLTCVDSRVEWLEKLPPESAQFKKRLFSPIENYLDEKTLDSQSYYIVMTMGHATDFPVLKKIMSAIDPAYIGVLGSEVKSKKIRRELLEAGVPAHRIENLKTPIGLVSNTNDPAEIAISIAAEILTIRENLKSLTEKKPVRKTE